MQARRIISLGWLLALMVGFFQPVFPQELDIDPISPEPPPPAAVSPPAGKAKPLSVTISKTLYLPPEMYGQWSVTGQLVESNTDKFFNPVVHDIWVLERRDDKVVISNPANGASATIQVDEVNGNTATFHRMVMSGKNKIYFEMPTITVEGDTLSGFTINKFQKIKDGRIKQSYYGRYRLQAQRISGSRVKFKDEPGPEDFEIEEIGIPRR